jgi:hypothetical protein
MQLGLGVRNFAVNRCIEEPSNWSKLTLTMNSVNLLALETASKGAQHKI